MSYYIGNIESCQAYNKTVTTAQKYKGVTNKWAVVLKKENEELYAIKKHPKYPPKPLLGLTEVEQLTDNWN